MSKQTDDAAVATATRRSRLGRGVVVGSCTVALLAASAAAALPAEAVVPVTAAVAAPGGLKVARTGDDQNTLAITWKAAQGAQRYTVSVFDGATQRSYVVPASAPSFSFKGSGNCTRYRVVVTTVGADGATAASNPFLVSSLAPGGLRNLKSERTDSGTAALFAWEARAETAGTAPVSSYKVQIRSMATGKVVVERDSADTKEVLTGLEPDRAYAATITPMNRWGGCATTRALLNGPRPSSPAIESGRDAASPARITVAWNAPVWPGYGPITGYEVGYRSPSMKAPVWVPAAADARSLDLKLDPNTRWSFWIRAVNGKAYGSLSKESVIERLGAPGVPAVDPSVKVSDNGDGIVSVAFNGPVGSSAVYPKMDVAIEPTMGGNGFSEKQEVFNRTGQYIFDSVPCGVFTVTVTGHGAATTKEFARSIVNRCNTGAITANLWKLVYGKAAITGNQVNMTYGNEARVVSAVDRASQDMVFTTDATLQSGWGYGIWTRASLVNGAAMSGYSFQFDPGYQNVDSKFGKALLLRVWQDGRECGNPIAKVQWPAGLEVNKTNRVVVVAKGDSLYATIGGKRMFDVPSLDKALASSGCNMKAPTGSQVGFRTWSGDGKASFSDTTIN